VGGALFGGTVDAVSGGRVALGSQQAPAFPEAQDRGADADIGGELADAGPGVGWSGRGCRLPR
jgi:hypothetical protein